MSEWQQHRNPWAEKLSQVSLPDSGESWKAMEALLDREMPRGRTWDRRRWFLLILLLLLLIGVCNCPGRRWLFSGKSTVNGVVPTVPADGRKDSAGKEPNGEVARDPGVARESGVARERGVARESGVARDPGVAETDSVIRSAAGDEAPPGAERSVGRTVVGREVGRTGTKRPERPGGRTGTEKPERTVRRTGAERTERTERAERPVRKPDAMTFVERPDGETVDKRLGSVSKTGTADSTAGNGLTGTGVDTMKVNAKKGDVKKADATKGDTKKADVKKGGANKGDANKGGEKKGGGKKEDSAKTERHDGWMVAVGLNQFFTVGGQQASSYNSGGITGTLGDYIPVPVLRYYVNPKLYVQLEAQINTPQYTKKNLVAVVIPADSLSPVQTVTRSVSINKLFYFNVPLSVHYNVVDHLDLGAGLQYSRLTNGIGVFNNNYNNNGTDSLATETKSFNGDSVYKEIKTYEFRFLVDANYNWKHFIVGVRYNQALSKFIHVQITPGQITQARNSSLQLYLRYILWDGRKKKPLSAK